MAALMSRCLVTAGSKKHVVVVDGTGQLSRLRRERRGQGVPRAVLKDASKLNERNQMAKALALRTGMSRPPATTCGRS